MRRFLFILAFLGACSRSSTSSRNLTLERPGHDAVTVALDDRVHDELLRTVETDDPYYDAHKRFRALPVGAVLSEAFGEDEPYLRHHTFVMRATDGYTVPIEGTALLDGHAFIALDDLDAPGFAPIGPRHVSPAPAYLIWEGSEHRDLVRYPRPWQLVAISIVDPRALYPHTLPLGQTEDSAAMRGFRIFRDHCIRCHAINREGGSVGPDLNVPQNILEYRPEEQVRAYIRDPQTFRYGGMPANPELGEDDLDALVAYFRVMSVNKHDPDGR